MQRGGLKPRAHCSASNSNVLGDIIVLMSDPSGDPDGAVGGAVNYYFQYQMSLDSRESRRRCKPRGPALRGDLVATMLDVSSHVKTLA
jgi:hypothetical protein